MKTLLIRCKGTLILVCLSRISQSISSQSVTVSGTTGAGSKHSHTRGTMEILGGFGYIGSNSCSENFKQISASNAFSVTYSSGLGNENASSNSNGRAYLSFKASNKWTGSTSEEKSHTHPFSQAVTIGSGSYTRPNSVSCLYIISY